MVDEPVAVVGSVERNERNRQRTRSGHKLVVSKYIKVSVNTSLIYGRNISLQITSALASRHQKSILIAITVMTVDEHPGLWAL